MTATPFAAAAAAPVIPHPHDAAAMAVALGVAQNCLIIASRAASRAADEQAADALAGHADAIHAEFIAPLPDELRAVAEYAAGLGA